MSKKQWNLIYIRGLLIFVTIILNFAYPSAGNAQQATKQPNLINSQQNSQSSSASVQNPKTYNVEALTCNPCFYVDSKYGSDSYPGTQPDKPWKTLLKLSQASLTPGTVVYLKRGSVWTESLRLTSSGQSGNPITITAYGSGADPILSYPGNTPSYCILNLVGNYIVIDHLHIQNSGYGIGIFSNHNIIQNSEINNIAGGISIKGQYNLITQNYIHDTRMFLNTPGGTDDWGGNGIEIGNDYNEISYNRMVNTEAPSYDWGMGGGAIEIWKGGDYTSIHHNRIFNSAGFMEVGGGGTSTANHVRIFYNLIINTTRFTYIHFTGNYAIQALDFRVENNTLIDLRSHNPMPSNFIGFDATPPADGYILRNNIIYISDYYKLSSYTFNHQNNIYYLLNSATKLGFTLGAGEKIVNPQFYDTASYEFHVKSTSPAINTGLNLGYTEDFDRTPVPIDTFPDIGAYEFDSEQTFLDVPRSHPYYQYIEALYAAGLTGGCSTSPLKYCPDQIMDRAQSAAFMLRGNFGPSYAPNPTEYLFQDADWSKGLWARDWAEAMREAGLTAGCKASPLLYCPWVQLPREQVVIFGLRMMYGNDYQPPAATGTVFADMTDPNYYATAWAEKAYANGLITNCGTSVGKPLFCPKELVNRGLGAYVIVKAKNLLP